MAEIRTTTAPNGLPVHRLAMPGARSLTALVAFDAGARTEAADENGMAHFLEHLVFKGGEHYDHYRKVNETAERMGAVLNAYTSHALVAFHITVRAEAAAEALDLLTDFAGRPKIDAEELDRERGVVIQEIARYADQPSSIADDLVDALAFGDHPLGRTVLGPEEHLRSFTREGIVAFRDRRWSGRSGGAFLAGGLDHLPDDDRLHELFGRFPDLPAPEAAEAAPRLNVAVRAGERDSNQSHLRLVYRPEIDPTDRAQRAALSVYSGLLGGSMGSRLFDEIREQRGLAYSVGSFAFALHDLPALQISAGLESGKLPEAYSRIREIVGELHRDGPTEDEVVRARASVAGRLVLGLESSGAVARQAASATIVHGEDPDPDHLVAAIDAVTHDDVKAVARAVDPDAAAAAVVGPHADADLAWAA